jgi:hypothetical protein
MVLTVLPYLAIPICLIGLIIALNVWNAKRAGTIAEWPRTEATVQSAGMEDVGSGRSKVVLPCFAFSYVVDEEYYSGRFSLSGCGDRSVTLIREMVGRKFTVLFDPTKPSRFQIDEEMIEGCDVGRVPD